MEDIVTKLTWNNTWIACESRATKILLPVRNGNRHGITKVICFARQRYQNTIPQLGHKDKSSIPQGIATIVEQQDKKKRNYGQSDHQSYLEFILLGGLRDRDKERLS